MYLKHLRKVEMIANREPEGLKKELAHYRSISELHQRNKLEAKHRKIRERERAIQQMNIKIMKKIHSMNAD